DSTYWVTVRPRINANHGRRAVAISRQPNSGTCAGTISDNDLKVDAIISPASSGRLSTSTALSASVPITIRIKNLDDAVSSGDINVSYSINAGAPVNETITTPIADIAAGSSIDHTFSTNANLSAVGTYSIQVTATKVSDLITANNSVTKVFKQLDNPVINNASLPWTDNLEATSTQTVTAAQMGLTGSDRYDFVNSTADGRLRTFINTGMAYSGSKAITLDMGRYVLAGNTVSLTGTFNLGTFGVSDEIRLDFRYKNHNQKTNAANKVWVRGSDGGSWIPMYDLFANQPNADGTYKLSGSLELNDSLTTYAQSFSSSFQVRWGQWGQYMAADNEGGAGYSFDDIRIYRAVDDIQMVSIDTPVVVACNLNTTVPVKATVRNTMNAAINNIPIVLKVDGLVVATESIATIAANSSLQYTFTATTNLSAPGNHNVEIWVDYGTDNVGTNDTGRVTVNS
ncbi:MAG: CARDB domain-containing protein, partial [Bacteroidota bacterium]